MKKQPSKKPVPLPPAVVARTVPVSRYYNDREDQERLIRYVNNMANEKFWPTGLI